MNTAPNRLSLNAGLAVILALLIASGWVCWRNMREMVEAGRWESHTHVVIRELGGLLSSLKDVENGQRGYLITGDPAYLPPYHAALGEEERPLRLRTGDKAAETRAAARMPLAGGLISLAMLLLLIWLLRRELGRRLAAERELRANRDHLAEIVDERTRELQEANTQLQTEILERGRAEDALRDSEARMRGVVDTAADGIITIDERGTMQTANPAVMRIFGYRREELIGRNVSLLLPEPDRSLHDQYLRNYLEAGQRKIIGLGREVLGRRQDGSVFPIELSVSEVWLGRTRIFTGIVRDITDRKQAGEAVRRSEEKYRIIVESATDYVIFTLDPDFRVTSWNSGAQHLLGYGESEILGQGMELIFTEEDRRLGVPAADIRNVLAFSRTRNERWYRRKDGSRFWGIGIMVARQDDEGQAIGYLKIIQDITDRKMAQEELERRVSERTAQLQESFQALEELNAKLQASNRELQDFAFVASHDLQEPLRKVMAFGDMLKSEFGGTLGETGADYLRRMQSAASRMQALISDLLQFSRVTTKAQPFTMVDLNQVAEGVLSDLEVRLRQSGGSVEVGPLPSIEADPMQMRQLLQNLVGNAIKFARPEAVPRVRIYAEPAAPAADPSAEADGSLIRLCVADNGIGFEEKYLDRIFTVFQRLHGRGIYEGTGIGLAICRKIAQRHGGTITASSQPGAGSTFIVTLPSRQTPGRTANGS